MYQVTQYSYKPSSWIDLAVDYHPFYYSVDSDMIEKLKEDLEEIRDDKIIHFLIIGLEDAVDILTADLPKIRKI